MAFKDMGVPEFSSERSKRTYSDHSKIGLLIIWRYLELSYESFSNILWSLGGVMHVARIERPSEQTTLRKFSRRLDPRILDKVFGSSHHPYAAMT